MIRFITSDEFLAGCAVLCVAMLWMNVVVERDHNIALMLDCQNQLAESLDRHPTVADLDWMEAQCAGGGR